MNQKIYRDPFVQTLLAIVVIIYIYEQTAASDATVQLTYALKDISGISFTSLVVYVLARPYFRKKQVRLGFRVLISLLIGFLIMIVLTFLAFGIAMSGG